MPRKFLFELEIPDLPDNIRLDIWGKESLEGTFGSKFIDHKNKDITISPALQAVFTNEDTGETLTFGVTGVFHTTGNTTKATGHNLLGDVFDGEFVLTKGNFTYSFDEQGNPSPLTGHGQEIPIIEFVLPIL